MLRPRPLVHLLAAASVAAACGGPSETSGFSTAPPTIPADAGAESTGSSSTGSSSTGSSSTGSSSTTDTSGGSSSSSASTWDMGPAPDFGGNPPGCQGKIDFVFVISSWYTSQLHQAQLNEAFPKFTQILRDEFEDFDYHVMVIDAGHTGGGLGDKCDSCYDPINCPDMGCACYGGPVDYPCHEDQTACDRTSGAGVTMPANFDASNKRCSLSGGNRYIIKDEPNLDETFQCIATLGGGPKEPVGMWSLMDGLQPEILGDGGCNKGFLRDEALLVVVFIHGTPDGLSPGDPQSWWEFLLAKKDGNPEAIVTLVVTADLDQPNPLCEGDVEPENSNRLHAFADIATHGRYLSSCTPSYLEFLEQGADLILDQCALLVPQ